MDRYTDAFTLGVELMDRDHRRLAELFDAFRDCLATQGVCDRLRELVAETLTAANDHFAAEEALMAAHNYPGADEEQLNHRNLRMHITTLVGSTVTNDLYDATTEENLATIERLLQEHINGPDRTLARFLNLRGVH